MHICLTYVNLIMRLMQNSVWIKVSQLRRLQRKPYLVDYNECVHPVLSFIGERETFSKGHCVKPLPQLSRSDSREKRGLMCMRDPPLCPGSSHVTRRSAAVRLRGSSFGRSNL